MSETVDRKGFRERIKGGKETKKTKNGNGSEKNE